MKLFVGIFIFFLSLEGGSWLLRKAGYSNQVKYPAHSLGSWSQVRTSNSQYKSTLLSWKKDHPEIDIAPVININLRNEPNNYVHPGIHGQKFLLSQEGLTPDIDDIFRVTGMNSGQEKYRVRYVIDKNGRRVTGLEKRKNASLNIILLGCSLTFSEGLQNEATLAGALGRKFPKANIYNLGIPAGSPAVSLRLLKENKTNALKEIDRKLHTIVLFTFIDDHMRRVIATSEQLRKASWIYRFHPFYELKDGKLSRKTDFLKDPWSFRWLLEWYGKTSFHQVTSLELPRIGEKEFHLVTEMFREITIELSTEFPSLQMFVAGYPGQKFFFPQLVTHLKNPEVRVFDYSEIEFSGLLNGHQDLLIDHHPSALAYDLYAELLAKSISSF